MNVDAAQYATISRQMNESGNWLQVYCNGNEYLDKPPLLFWLSALSFKIFGVHNWSYKLPSFLFAILGIYSTKKLGELLYDIKTGMVAALMLVSCLGILIMTNDIRTDTILLGSTVFATWQILLFVNEKRFLNLFFGFFGIGLAMLSKGPLGIVLPAMVLSCEFAYKRQWKNFFRWEWIVGLMIVAVMLFPMCYGLYEQFDLHPEKIVNGQTGVSGLKFYFWTQSFGRITGDSQWGTKFDNGAGPFFFTHTFMWAFFPWSILVVAGMVKTLFVLIKNKFQKGFITELLSVGGFILVFISLSASRYKLPHYIYVTFPFAAIIASRFLLEDVLNPVAKKLRTVFSVFHWIFLIAGVIVCNAALFVFFPGAGWMKVVISAFGFVLAIVFAIKSKTIFMKLMYPLLAGLLSLYFIVDSHFYPNLLQYQSTSMVGKRMANEKRLPDQFFYYHDISMFALDFYSGFHVKQIDTNAVNGILERNHSELSIYTDESGVDDLKKLKHRIMSIDEMKDYSVQFLTINFLLPQSRPACLRKRFLVKISGQLE